MHPRKLWLDALRSGQYEQTTGKLHAKGDGYCCLGVACELYRIQTGAGYWKDTSDPEEDSVMFVTDDEDDEHSSYLPADVAEWLGDLRYDPLIDVPSKENSFDRPDETASSLNDNGFSFRQIADVIEYLYGTGE